MKKTIAVSLLVVLGAGLSGCSQGIDANTTIQGETGSGTRLVAGLMEVQALAIVASETGGTGAVSAVVVNNGTEPDSLEGIVVGGRPVDLQPQPVIVLPNKSVKIETGATVSAQGFELEADPGTYTEVTLNFAKSGSVTGEVLVVPPVSFYESAAPAAPAPVVVVVPPAPAVEPPTGPAVEPAPTEPAPPE